MNQIQYLTNDSWEIVSGIDGENGWPILHEADYSKGHFYVLTVPDNFADFYNMPAPVLNKIRETLCAGLPVQLEGAAEMSIYVYDNNSFIVESFLDTETAVTVLTPTNFSKLTDLNSGQVIAGVTRSPGMSWTERQAKEKLRIRSRCRRTRSACLAMQ